MSAPVAGPVSGLPAHDAQVALLVAEGLTNQQIARRVGRTEDGVKSCLLRVFKRLGVHNRVQLAARVGAAGAPVARAKQITALVEELGATGLDAGQRALLDQLSALVTGSRP